MAIVPTPLGPMPEDQAARLAKSNPRIAQALKQWQAKHPAPTTTATGGKTVAKSPVPSLKLPGATTVKVNGVTRGTVNVAAIRQFLIGKGYDLPHDNHSGVLGQRLAAAINDWGVARLPKNLGGSDAVTALMKQKWHWKPDAESGRQDPKKFNPVLGVNSKVAPPIKKVLGDGAGFTDSTRADGATYDPSGLTKSVPDVVPIDEALAKNGAQLVKDPNKLADALAGLQYDSSIRDLAHQRDVNVEQTKQNEHDIGSWYDQALASLKTAGERDKAINTAGLGSVKSADASILASLGGDASGAASTVASAAQQNEGTLAALGAVQDSYNADIQPIVGQERAGQITGERAKGTQRALDLATQIASAKAERGGSVASHLFDIQQMNNTIRDNQLARLLQIKDANRQQTQQDFQNRMAVDQAKLAALATGAKILSYGSKPVKGSFADTPASVKAQIANTIFNDLHQAGTKDPKAAQAIVAARLRGAGWNISNPAVGTYAQGILTNWSQTQQ